MVISSQPTERQAQTAIPDDNSAPSRTLAASETVIRFPVERTLRGITIPAGNYVVDRQLAEHVLDRLKAIAVVMRHYTKRMTENEAEIAKLQSVLDDAEERTAIEAEAEAPVAPALANDRPAAPRTSTGKIRLASGRGPIANPNHLIDTDPLKRNVDLRDLIAMSWKLTRDGSEAIGLCPFHKEKTPSFRVWPDHYHCFGCNKHGDAIDWLMEMGGLQFRDACEALGADSAAQIPPQDQQQQREHVDIYAELEIVKLGDVEDDHFKAGEMSPPIFNPKRADDAQRRFGTFVPSMVFPYRNEAGELLGYVLRRDFKDGGKETPTVQLIMLDGERTWARVPFREPRPLYGLDRLRKNPTHQIIIPEGEAASDAADRIFETAISISWPGGANGVGKVDVSPLKGRSVLFVPDADLPGYRAMLGYTRANDEWVPGLVERALQEGASTVKFIHVMDPGPDDFVPPKGWDLRDAEKEGWDEKKVLDWGRARLHVFKSVKDVRDKAPSLMAVFAEPSEPKPTPQLEAETAAEEPRAEQKVQQDSAVENEVGFTAADFDAVRKTVAKWEATDEEALKLAAREEHAPSYLIDRDLLAFHRGCTKPAANDLIRGFRKTLQRAAADRRKAAKLASGEYDEQQQVLDELNERYAVVNDIGKTVVFRRVHDPALNRYLIERSSFEDFKRLYQNRQITAAQGGDKPDKFAEMGEFWLRHADRRQYPSGVVFDPSGKAPDDCWNMWAGFPTKPSPGDWNLMREHIRTIICNGNEERFQYLIKWLARMYQQPSRQGDVAVIMRGDEGIGKGTLGNWICRSWGQHAIHIAQSRHLVGNFNSHLRDCVFVFADEAFFAGDKQHIGALNAIITEPTLMIEPKGRDAFTVPNMTHVMMASNNDWVVPARGDARRYFVLDVPATKKDDRPYFEAIGEQMEAGGMAAMIHDLLAMGISDFSVTRFPVTEALNDQKTRSMSNEQAWLASILRRGYAYRGRHGAPEFQDWREVVSTDLLYASYLQHCTDVGSRRDGVTTIGKFLTGVFGGCRRLTGWHPINEIDREPFIEMKDRPNGYRFGSLAEARASFVKATKIPIEWGDEAEDMVVDDTADDPDLPL